MRIPKILLVSAALLILLGASYFYFQSFRPKAQVPVEQKESTSTLPDFIDFPAIPGSVELGTSQTSAGAQFTLQTERSMEDISSYYKNIFTEKGWKLETTDQEDGALKERYEREGYKLVMSVSGQENSKTRVVNISVTKN
jgi:hypothetical protein